MSEAEQTGASRQDKSGRLLAGRYRLGVVLGRGGMGTVWRAEDETLGRTVAVKELRFPSSIDEDEKRRLITRTLREAKAIARIRNNGAVTVFDVVDEDDRPWIVMELVEGKSLAEAIREDGLLTPTRAAEVGLAILDVLRAAHREGILHRDVKPSNVLISEDGRVVLTDFGIAQVEGDPSITSTGMLVGAPSYISPERARGHKPGPAADLWSLGGLLYAAVEGVPPYDKGSAIATLTAVMTEPVEQPKNAGPLEKVIYGLLAKDPDQRLDDTGARAMLNEVIHAPTSPETGPQAPDATKVVAMPPVPDEGPGRDSSTGSGGKRGEEAAVRLRGALRSVRKAATAAGAATAAAAATARTKSGGTRAPGSADSSGASGPSGPSGASGASGGSGADGVSGAAGSGGSAKSASASAGVGAPASGKSGASGVGAGASTASGVSGASTASGAGGSGRSSGPGGSGGSGSGKTAGAAGAAAAVSGTGTGPGAGTGAGKVGARDGATSVSNQGPGQRTSGWPEVPPARPRPVPRAPLTDVVPRRTLVIVAVVVVLAVLGAVLALTLGGDDGSSKDTKNGDSKAAASGATAGSADKGKDSGSHTDSGEKDGSASGSDGSGTGTAAGSTPSAGANDDANDDASSGSSGSGDDGSASGEDSAVKTYKGDQGFSIGLPKGWKYQSTSDAGVRFTGPDGQKLLVGWTSTPKNDPVADWKNQEHYMTRQQYKRVRIEKVDYRGWNTADWEFTYVDGGTKYRSIDRGFVVDSDLGYGLMYTAKDAKWGSDLRKSTWQTLTSTFEPKS
ncbi:serine/threonine-protein kinase [Streptomyces sp. NPDC058371]|uniref:serine/threonine-protein kinase n=1 Tax=Streptomyces sp. NPDC058371 TaxID=3346463 RepID=UPI0036541353